MCSCVSVFVLDCLLLSVPASSTARVLVASLLQELQDRDCTIKSLRAELAQTARSATPEPPTTLSSEAKAAESELVISDLKSQLGRLEYENAKLKLDVQNRWVLEVSWRCVCVCVCVCVLGGGCSR